MSSSSPTHRPETSPMETSPPPVENPVPAPPPTSPMATSPPPAVANPVPASPPTSPMPASPPPAVAASPPTSPMPASPPPAVAVANQPDPQVRVRVRAPLTGRARLKERVDTKILKDQAEFAASLKRARRIREKRKTAAKKRQRTHVQKDTSSSDDDQKAEADSEEDTSDEGSEEHNGDFKSFLRDGPTNDDGQDFAAPIDNTDCLDEDDKAGPKPRSSSDED